MGRGYHWIGIEKLKHSMKGDDLEAIEYFPSITPCKFII